MTISITARHFKLSEERKEEIKADLQQLAKYYDGINHMGLVIRPSQAFVNTFQAELTAKVHRQVLKARGVAASPEEVSMACRKTMRQQVIRYKDKLRGKHKYAKNSRLKEENLTAD